MPQSGRSDSRGYFGDDSDSGGASGTPTRLDGGNLPVRVGEDISPPWNYLAIGWSFWVSRLFVNHAVGFDGGTEDCHYSFANPDKLSENPHTNLENPDTISGNPDTISEDPDTHSEDPDKLSGNPDTAFENPATISEDPDKLSGNPDAHFGSATEFFTPAAPVWCSRVEYSPGGVSRLGNRLSSSPSVQR